MNHSFLPPLRMRSGRLAGSLQNFVIPSINSHNCYLFYHKYRPLLSLLCAFCCRSVRDEALGRWSPNYKSFSCMAKGSDTDLCTPSRSNVYTIPLADDILYEKNASRRSHARAARASRPTSRSEGDSGIRRFADQTLRRNVRYWSDR